MISPVLQAGGMLAKRAVSSLATAPTLVARFDVNDEPQQPPIKWAPYGGLQLFFNLLLFVPIFLYIGYTLTHIYPTLAIVEDPLPEYTSIPIDEPANNPTDPTINKSTPPNPLTINNNNGGNSSSQTSDAPVRTKPITSSLRATHRTLSSISGFPSHFRGLGCFLFLIFVTSILSSIFSIIPILGNLAVLLLTSQLQTALTHIIISAPRPQPGGGSTFFSRLPAWRRNLVATHQPILFYWASVHAAVILPVLLSKLIGLSPLDSSGQLKDGITGVEIAQLICVLGVFIGLNLLLVVPAHVALVRVQATLLPHEEETIVPFDRTFGGSVEPEVINGKGFGNLKNALRTVSWASWVRLYLQQVKIMGVMIALYAVVFGVLGFEYAFLGWRN